MIIKYFDEFEGQWIDVTGNTGAMLVKGVNDWNTTQGYLLLSLVLNQSTNQDPTYTELENTTGCTYTITRNSQGDYRMILSQEILSQGKTQIFIQQSDSSLIQVRRTDINEINIRTADDNVLLFTSLEIRIYN